MSATQYFYLISSHLETLTLNQAAFELQSQLRKAFMGKAFWTRQTKHRVGVHGNKDIIRLHNELYQRNGEVAYKMHEYLQEEEAARQERKKSGKRAEDDYDMDGSAAGDSDFDEYESD